MAAGNLTLPLGNISRNLFQGSQKHRWAEQKGRVMGPWTTSLHPKTKAVASRHGLVNALS